MINGKLDNLHPCIFINLFASLFSQGDYLTLLCIDTDVLEQAILEGTDLGIEVSINIKSKC